MFGLLVSESGVGERLQSQSAPNDSGVINKGTCGRGTRSEAMVAVDQACGYPALGRPCAAGPGDAGV